MVKSHYYFIIFFFQSCFRNRLESNAEHWNSLLLSLHELIEWVIRKNAELESLGPMGGDTISLQKQLVSCFGKKPEDCTLLFNLIGHSPSE